MFKQIRFSNYKAFENAELAFKPITILLGANNVGKSSVIQLLLMLAQTANDKNNLSALQVNGHNISLGTNNNIFRLKDVSKPITLSFKLSDDFEYTILQNMYEPLYRLLYYEFLNLKNMGYDEVAKLFKHSTFFTYVSESDKNFNNVCKSIKDGYNKYENIAPSYITHIVPNSTKLIDECMGAYELLNSISEIIRNQRNNLFCKLTICYNKSNRNKTNILYLSDLGIYYSDNDGEKKIININIKKPLSRAKLFFTSDVVSLSKLNQELNINKKQIINDVRSNIFNYFKEISQYDLYRSYEKQYISLQLYSIVEILQKALKSVEETINENKICYVSPLRAYPQRFYFLDRTISITSLDTLKGEEIAVTIKNDEYLKSKINNWLRHFNIQIEVQTLENLIHKLKVKHGKLQLDITDVGFGISQVLPLITQGFISKEDSMIIIEQPEVHLHPKMQAELVDLFIDISLPKSKSGKRDHKKTLLIETHSEYMLKRIRRRIAEGVISYNDVGIYYLERIEGNTSNIRKIDISTTGSFDWPEEFYGGELLNDMLEFIKYQ